MKAEIVDKILLPEIPSASGIELAGDQIFIIGDDSQYLFLLNRNFQTINKIPLFDAKTNNEGKISKAEKPDLEALTIIVHQDETYLLALGSGSVRELRDVAYLISLKDYSVTKISLLDFYDHLRETFNSLQAGTLNIEGALLYNQRIYLFHRGNITGKNIMVSIELDHLLRFTEIADTTSILLQEVALPTLNELHAGFSGACLIPGTSQALFTASVENTPNAIDDGPSAGSYVGILDLSDKPAKVSDIQLLHDQELPFLKKVESITVLQQINKNTLEAIAVCDEDVNPSWVLSLEITI
ncbi:MAG: hypothetical protein ABIO46_07575 [Chitinophagales bacterium]